MAAFVSFHHPVCQLQVFGYGEEAAEVLTTLEADGWRKVGEPIRGQGAVSQRYFGGPEARPMTMVVNRRSTQASEPTLDMIINIVPGKDPDRGVLN